MYKVILNRVEELIDIKALNLWKSFQDSILKACVKVWQKVNKEK